jgi:sugar phosphate isomerase/epimerase
MLRRRGFLKLLASGAGAAALGRFAGATTARAARLDRVGLQLYTVRGLMEKDFDGTLASVASIGYKDVEFAGYYGRTSDQVKAVLAKNGLKAPSAHFSLDDVRNKWSASLDTAAAIGHEYVVLAWLAPNERGSLDNYRKLADLLNKAGEAAKARGLQMAYHNHDFEFVETDGGIPYDVLLERADAKLVALEMDLYWTAKAGRDPIAYFEKYPGRFHLLHVKDMAKTPEQGFAEVGRGQIDFAKIFKHSKKAGARHFFVEQDQTPGSPLDSAKISYDFVSRLTF